MSIAETRAFTSLHVNSASEKSLASREFIRLLVIAGAVIADLVILTLACAIGSYLRFGDLSGGNGGTFLAMVLPAFLFAGVTFHAYRLDTLRLGLRSALRANAALLLGGSFAMSAAFALQVGEKFSRLETGFMIVLGVILLSWGRVFGALLLARLQSVVDDNTFLLGDDTALNHVAKVDRLYNVRVNDWTPDTNNPEFLDLLSRTFRHADRVLLLFEDAHERAAWANFMRITGINAELVEPQLAQIVPTGIGRWNGAPTLVVSRGPLSLSERALKRALDVGLTLLLAPAVLPLVGFLAALIRLESPGPAFFVQDRVGKKNGLYRCYKFRTMYAETTDTNGDRSVCRDDNRLTRTGKFLRRTSLDELPQLWNVLRGEMSLVGPRPHALGSKAGGALFWEAVDGYWARHAMKPGLTGLAQVRGFRGTAKSRGDIENRVAADLEYVNSWSIWLDLRILIRTPFVLVHRRAY